ncbi:MAG: prephenate dehydratase [Acidobacteriota bacterium]|nr:prephenate dehydratase [Acidobacteriota bacterium]
MTQNGKGGSRRRAGKSLRAPQNVGKLVAFQGELGAFSHAAALKVLGERIKLLPCKSFKDVFESLKSDSARYAVIPIENTLHGSVHENYDHLLDYGFVISGETSIRISHQLITVPGVRFRDIKRVFSHPVALNQCKRFFDEHQNIEAVPHYDTAGSVKLLTERRLMDGGAIASTVAAQTYGGVIVRRNIEDMRQNFTRFFLLTKHALSSPAAIKRRKSSIVFATTNTPGALFRAMACFALRDINLTKIESRPFRGKPWEYLFYVDFLASSEEKIAQSALANLKECTQFVKLLGSYQPTP